METAGEILNMRNRIPIRFGDFIQESVVSTWPPVSIGFRNHVERAGPGRGGWPNDAQGQHMLELSSGRCQAVWSQPTSAGMQCRAGSHNMVLHRVLDRQVITAWFGEAWELGKQVGECWCCGHRGGNQGAAERCGFGRNAIDLEVSGVVTDGASMKVDLETEPMEEISPQDRLLHVSNDKYPRECSSKTKVKGQTPLSESQNSRVISSAELTLSSLIDVAGSRLTSAPGSTRKRGPLVTSR
eukprot:scpid23757/ scgid22706/ 